MAQFDQYARQYEEIHNRNLGALGESSAYFDEHKVLELKKFLAAQGRDGAPLRILDYGCGIGKTLAPLRQHLPQAEYTGADASSESLQAARERWGKGQAFLHFDGKRLPTDEGSFDVVFAACVVHHIEPALRHEVFQEWHRVLRPGGFAFVFEHNPWNPATQYIVSTCEFDQDAQLISRRALCRQLAAAGLSTTEARYVIFLPKALRQRWASAEERLAAVPLGAQYWVAAEKR